MGFKPPLSPVGQIRPTRPLPPPPPRRGTACGPMKPPPPLPPPPKDVLERLLQEPAYLCYARQNGWLSADDVRRAEGLPPNETMTEGDNSEVTVFASGTKCEREIEIFVPYAPLNTWSPYGAMNVGGVPKMGDRFPGDDELIVHRRSAKALPKKNGYMVTVGFARTAIDEVLRDIERPPQMLGYEGSPWPFANAPWRRIWYYAWRIGGYLAWAGGCWLLAEWV